MFFTHFCFAVDLNVDVIPENPRQNEPYTVYFRVTLESEDKVDIKFDSENLEVISKENQGVSSQTTYINGNYSQSKELTYAYEVKSSLQGSAKIKNIKIVTEKGSNAFSDIEIPINKEMKVEDRDLFALAVPSKNSVFVGESFIVRYYVYTNKSIAQIEINKFPELQGFVKRYVNEGEVTERVEYKGKNFNRALLYSVQLFANTPGTVVLDSMSVTTRKNEIRDTFGFGLGLSIGGKPVQLISSPINITVKPLPAGAPSSFTGLVGNHHFELSTSKSKYLANEPIEMSLKVSGEGLLENYKAPTLFSASELEKFDDQGSLDIKNFKATKNFRYTYLGRKNITIPSHQISFSYFNPASLKYETQNIMMPEIFVDGASSLPPIQNIELPKMDESTVTASSPNLLVENFIPEKLAGKWLYFIWGIFSTILLLLLGYLLKKYFYDQDKINKSYDLSKFKQNNFHFGDLYRFLMPLAGENMSLENAIKSSHLNLSSKTYFLNLVSHINKKEYAAQDFNLQYKFDKNSFNDMVKKYYENTR